MWARVVEFMLACWLGVSPFVFQHGDELALLYVDYLCAMAIIFFSLMSWWPKTWYAHLGSVGVAMVLVFFGRFADGFEPGPAYQNHMLTGFLLLMFAVCPNNSKYPPPSYRQKSVSVS